MNNKEIWKDIVNYEDNYQVSNFGNIRSKDRYIKCRGGKLRLIKGKLIKPNLNNASNGYLKVGLYKNNKQKDFLVHRLVAEYFINNPENLQEVNHKDGNKDNNNVNNLEWVTHRYNTQHSYNIGLRDNQRTIISNKNKLRGKFVIQYDKDMNIINTFESLSQASRSLNINQGYLGKIIDTAKLYKNYLWYSSYQIERKSLNEL